MSDKTKIQWADSTVNPVMGCGGCELYPSPAQILREIDVAVNRASGQNFNSREELQLLIDGVFAKPVERFRHKAHKPILSGTNIWHLRNRLEAVVGKQLGKSAGVAAKEAVEKSITCYAAKLHLARGTNIMDLEGRPEPRGINKGYAPTFESVTRFEGRSADAANLPDLVGTSRKDSPWKNGLPRLVFVSDMGDAFSAKADFGHLMDDLMPAILSDNGSRHLWMWLTKRPARMAEFAREIGGFPKNVCAMTTLTGPDEESLGRLAAIKTVKAHCRGLSIEPLWDRIPPSKLKLDGIDWVILGGESGKNGLVRPFAIEWAEELRAHCQKQGVAFFLKQLGRRPQRDLKNLVLRDTHGGNWMEWDVSLRTREFPKHFHDYRKGETAVIRIQKGKTTVMAKKGNIEEVPDSVELSPADRADFDRLDAVVRNGIRAFILCGQALAEIHERQLWKAEEGATTWEDYCRNVAGISKAHAHRLMDAANIAVNLGSSPIGDDIDDVGPRSESQVRPLVRLDTPEKRSQAWEVAVKKANGQPTARQVVEAVFEVMSPQKKSAVRLSKSQRRVSVVKKLKLAIRKQNSWEDVQRLVDELEELL